MKTTVYIDVLISVNTIVNYFLLKSISALSGATENKNRILFSSVIGGIFSLFIFIDLSKIFTIFLKIMSVFICSLIAFDFYNWIVFSKIIISSFIVNSAFTGLILFLSNSSGVIYFNNGFYYIGISPVVFVLSVVAVYISITVIEYIFVKTKDLYFDINIINDDNVVTTKAFYDTGFKVKDILTHRPVMMTNYEFIKENVPGVNLDFLTGNNVPVFYSDVSGEGMLPCIKLSEVNIGNTKMKDVLLAVSESNIFDDVKIIFGKDIYNMIGK